jgi:hypothetical protein
MNRRKQVKSAGGADKWKENVRARCLDTLKKKRKEKMQHLRKADVPPTEEEISDALRLELEAIRSEERALSESHQLTTEEFNHIVHDLEEILFQEYLSAQEQYWDDGSSLPEEPSGPTSDQVPCMIQCYRWSCGCILTTTARPTL